MELLTGTAEIDDLDAFVAELDVVGDEHDCAVQAFDARYVAGPKQLERAVTLANRATERGETIARHRSVEILLYAAGRRQITARSKSASRKASAISCPSLMGRMSEERSVTSWG